MKKILSLLPTSFLFLSVLWLLISACNNGTTQKTGETKQTKAAEAVITGTQPDTTVTGTAKFSQEGNGKVKLILEIAVPKLASHEVAVHIHEHGDCGDAGKNTHGHWNPTNKKHGKWGSMEFHSGDIGNISLDASGKGSFELETELWSIGGDAQKDVLGKAIIVHGGVDDYTSQPAGNAGSRIGCGLIEKK